MASRFNRELDVKYGPLLGCGFGPEPAAMGHDNAPADRQPQAKSQGLRAVERLDQLLHAVGGHSVAAIGDRNTNMAVSIPCCLDEEEAVAVRSPAHGFGRVDDQIEKNLLKLDRIALNGRQVFAELGACCNCAQDEIAMGKRQRLRNEVID